MKKTIKLTENELKNIVTEAIADIVSNNTVNGAWDAIVNDEYKSYDRFVDLLKNYYAPNNNELAYQIEDDIHSYMTKMFEMLDKKYNNRLNEL